MNAKKNTEGAQQRGEHHWQPSCPVEFDPDGERVLLAHGEGARLSRKLIRERILPALGAAAAVTLDDAARLPGVAEGLAVTTDSFVVSPLFFPGGDIGSLAVHGTVNDLAVSGAEPLCLTLAMILEEGLPLELLDRVLQSAAAAASRAAVRVVAGDTKVVPRGAADGMFITATGIGRLVPPAPPGPAALQPGDRLLVSGPVGRHGIAVLCAREDLALTPPPESDSAPLHSAAAALRGAVGGDLRAMRDATRGGVAAVLHEWAEASGQTLVIEERLLPQDGVVRGACELLGLDPLHVANEGTMVVAVEGRRAEEAAAALQSVSESAGAAVVGEVAARQFSPVVVRRPLGGDQPLDEPPGAPLPRIC